MKKLIRSVAARLVRFFVARTAGAQEAIVKGYLGSCGERVSIRQPTVVENAGEVHVGDDVSIASFVHIWGSGGVRIGSRTMIGSHAAVSSVTHDAQSPEMWRTIVHGPVVIGEDVWIGSHAVIFPGVKIGNHAVVGAGAVVRADVKAYTVVAGVPAAFVREIEIKPDTTTDPEGLRRQ